MINTNVKDVKAILMSIYLDLDLDRQRVLGCVTHQNCKDITQAPSQTCLHLTI